MTSSNEHGKVETMNLRPDDYSRPGTIVDRAPADEHLRAIIDAMYAARDKTNKSNNNN